jgi:hypothetical protein
MREGREQGYFSISECVKITFLSNTAIVWKTNKKSNNKNMIIPFVGSKEIERFMFHKFQRN